MRIGNELLSWYIRNIMSPNVVRYDNPGFVITAMDTPFGHTFQRDILFAESLISNIEIETVKKYGNRGKEALYSIGKQFGYNYSKLFNIPTIEKTERKTLEKFVNYAVMFISATWAKRIDYDLDYDKKIMNATFDEYVVCRKNGIGEIFPSGATTGALSWVFNDYTIEGTQLKCQGRGDKECEFICAPREYLRSKKIDYCKSDDHLDVEYSEKYLNFNRIQRTYFSKVSSKELITQGVFKYKDNMIVYKNERYFPIGAEFLYILEHEFGKLDGGLDLLFNVAFETGSKLVDDKDKNNLKFITDYMSALGWGDVGVLSKDGITVVSNFFPWVGITEKIDFVIFRGLVSGILSASLRKDIKFNKIKTRLGNSFFIAAVKD